MRLLAFIHLQWPHLVGRSLPPERGQGPLRSGLIEEIHVPSMPWGFPHAFQSLCLDNTGLRRSRVPEIGMFDGYRPASL